MGWKMVYNFLGIDKKTKRNLPTFDQTVRTVYSNIRIVYPSKNHVTTHPVNIDNPYFEQMVGQIYPTELQLNKANSSDTEAPFLDLNLSITNGIVSSKMYDKRDDFNFEIVNFPFLDGDVPRSPYYGVNISQLIRFF